MVQFKKEMIISDQGVGQNRDMAQNAPPPPMQLKCILPNMIKADL